MKKEELFRKLIDSDQRSIIAESGSILRTQNQLITVLQDKFCSFSFDSHCGECRDCKRIARIQENIHPDILYFGGDLFTIDNARQLLRAVQSEPIELDFRIVVIASDRASVEAQNAILKLLEEDSDFQAKSKFIFIVRSASQLVQTIQSRSFIISFEANSTREFLTLVRQKEFVKAEYVAYLASWKESNLRNILYIKDKFNLNVEDLYDKIDKMYKASELTLEFFTTLEELRAYPFVYVYRAIEYQIIRTNKALLPKLETFYSLFYKTNRKKTKNVRDNLAILLQAWYYLNKPDMFEQYAKEM